MKYRSSTIKSKWIKNNWLLKQPNLRKYVPQTMLFNKKNLITMLDEFSTVFFKPTGGSGGVNIIRIRRKTDGYEIQYHSVKTYYPTITRLFKKLHRFSKQKSFLLQKGIDLARTNGKPFDIRVMVQKTNKGKWKSTAIFAKIGNPRKVATNYNQGGKIGYINDTLSGAGYNKASVQRMEKELKRLGTSVGRNFERHSKGMRELGLDVALDANRKPWILEVNTRPQFYPLKNMKDKKLYRRIVSYAKQYGRYK
ncbi:glutathione synthase/RimK-type ligase-like ATP-grasp enzyme [Paenibacillus castaneae]|uniref:YheC/YheD family protein n=1 Tax=Paenibacillus castaneae TaxID=474957 RepID=UPI000C9AFB38|nr:YheC/YheD family protein [Paenibacillus castaneae]NIK74964.1 glutathione synthase/RimK-type ligase-like ATP-grasp enzyme [Paenibacillus castaneae]